MNIKLDKNDIEKNQEKNKKEKLNEIKQQRIRNCNYFSKKKYKLKYCLYPGNNSKLIDQVMKYRNEVWEKAPISNYRFCDLVWAPLTSTIDFKSSQYIHQIVNHIQFNEEITN